MKRKVTYAGNGAWLERGGWWGFDCYWYFNRSDHRWHCYL